MSNTAQIITTQQVVITEVQQDVVEVTAPQAPAVVEVTTEGPQAPVRIGRVLTDATTSGVIYVGTAPIDATEAQPRWSIAKSAFSAAGIRTSRGTASNVTWTGRTSHTYT